jgi:hypothetical protein
MAETYQGNDFDYTGLHAFVFIDGVDPGGNVADVVEALGGPDGRGFPNGRALFASVLVGMSSTASRPRPTPAPPCSPPLTS